MNKKVSLITAVLNRVDTIADTLESILNQDYPDIECIVVDGGSTDGSLNVIKKYKDIFGEKLIWSSEPDIGLYDAINKGIKKATGDIIGIINSDDYYHQTDTISNIVKEFDNDSSIEAVYGDVHYILRNDKSNNMVRYYSSKFFRPFLFRFGFMPPHPSFFTYKRLYDDIGYYRTNYHISGDFELIMRFMKIHNIKVKYIDLDVLTMRTGGLSTSSFHNTMALNKEVHRACISNHVYTNYILLYMRYFVKILEWFPYLNFLRFNKCKK